MEQFKNRVNISLQVIPVSKDMDSYTLVDRAISVICDSGVDYLVGPMETAMEGDYDELMSIVKKAQEAVLDAGADKVISLIKVEWSASEDISIKGKIKSWGANTFSSGLRTSPEKNGSGIHKT